jgi:hypothetical protein
MMRYNEDTADSLGSRRNRESITLAEYLRSHQAFKNLTQDKVEVFRKYIEENPKGKYIKQTKYIGRSFIDKCPDHLLAELVSRIYEEFREYLLSQKRTDDEKLKRIAELSNTSEDRDALWRGGFDQFCNRERERSREFRRR